MAANEAQHGGHRIKLLNNATITHITIHFIAKMISCSKKMERKKNWTAFGTLYHQLYWD